SQRPTGSCKRVCITASARTRAPRMCSRAMRMNRRIDLIRAMLEKGGAPDPKTVAHLDSCLSCLSCMTTCAVKVDYVHLIDRGAFQAPADRACAACVSRARAAASTRVRRVYVARTADASVETVEAAFPPRIVSDVLVPQVFQAEGAVRKRVVLLAGCAQQALNGNINAATIRLLRRHGCEVVIAPWGNLTP